MEEELDQLKSVLRSLVVSCPTQVDARSLLRDYRSMVGSQLPFAKFGYRDHIAFLRERCSDCFLGSPANPDLTLIVPDALKHVDKFVQKQKVSSHNSAAKYKGKRRSVLASAVQPSPDLITSTFRHGQSMPNRRMPETVQKEQEYTNCILSTKVKENTAVNNDTGRHNGTQHTRSQVNSREWPQERRESIREDDDSRRLTASSSSSGRRSTQLEELKRELRELVVEHPDGVFCTDLIRLYRQRHSCELNFSRFGFTSVLSLAGSVDGVRVTLDAAHGDWLLSDAARAPPALRPAPRVSSSATPRARPSADPENALPGIPYKRPQERRASIREDDDSGRLTASSSSSGRKRTQLEELKRELRDLVVEHPDGLFCTDLIRLYRQRHSCELNFSRFGFTSVLSLAGSVDGVRVTHDPAQGDWLLSDEARAPPVLRPAPRAASTATPRARPAADPEDALPGIPYAPEVFPPDCMGLLDSIPALSLAGIKPGDQLEVSVGEVYSPSHFWLQRLGDEYNIAMETVMDEMNLYYSSEEGRSRRLLPGAVRVGFYCSSCYDGDWHRSLIVRLLDGDTVKVRHVDYGTVERCSVSGLRPLRREWAALPVQALRGLLARVRPPAAGRRWPRAAALYFLRLVRDRRLVATVSAVDTQEDALEVFLTDTSTDEDLCITDQLVRAGHADPRDDDAHGTSECYLFPRFSALESGATPNFAEIHAYLRDGIALEFVDEYRQHVPPCLPPAGATAALGAPPPTDDTSSSNDDDAPGTGLPPALHNRVPLFPTQQDDPTHTRRDVPVCATAPQPAQQYTPQFAPQQAMRYYPLHPAPSVPNLSYSPSVPNLSYRTQTPDNCNRLNVQPPQAPLYSPNRLVYMTQSEAEAALALSYTAPHIAFRFLMDKVQSVLVSGAPLNPDAAEFRSGTLAPQRPPPGFEARPPQ